MVTRWGPWQLTYIADALTLDPSGATLAHDGVDPTRRRTTAAETFDRRSTVACLARTLRE